MYSHALCYLRVWSKALGSLSVDYSGRCLQLTVSLYDFYQELHNDVLTPHSIPLRLGFTRKLLSHLICLDGHVVFHAEKGWNYLQIQVLWASYKAGKKRCLQNWSSYSSHSEPTRYSSASLWSSMLDHIQARPAWIQKRWSREMRGRWVSQQARGLEGGLRMGWWHQENQQRTMKWTLLLDSDSDKNQDGTKWIVSWNNENKHLKNTWSHLSNNLTTHHYNGFRFVE